MFEKLIRDLDNLNNSRISIPIETDEDGFSDRQCPSENCRFYFKVLEEDWSQKFSDEHVFCPFCGEEATSDQFWTDEQINHAKKQAHKYLEGKINQALAQGARDFNRAQPKKGFITMSMTFKGSTHVPFILPIPAKKELEQKLKCSKCEANYSVLGSAFFCPCCGYNSVKETFDNSLKKIESNLKNLDLIKKAVSEVSVDEAETTTRSLLESGLSDCITAFQRYCEAKYQEHPKAKKRIKRNAFQNIEIGSNLWNDVLGESYSDWINHNQQKQLNILFQKRHLLQHNEGLVDHDYISKSNDQSYKAGQRIVIHQKDVQTLIELIRIITGRIADHIK